MKDKDKIILALDIAIDYGQIEGDHHKAWVIDQMVRRLAGDEYEQVIREACEYQSVPGTFEWNVGIAP